MKLLISDRGVYLNDQLVPVTQVHLDLDAREQVAHVQLVVSVPVEDLTVDLADPRVRVVVDEPTPRSIVDLAHDEQLHPRDETGRYVPAGKEQPDA